MAKKTKEESPKESEEEYLKYVIKDCTFNITVEEGGQVIFQTGQPSTSPPKPPGQ